MDFAVPFRGSAALTSGLLTPGVLRGPRFRRLFPDVYIGAGVEVDLALRARAAYLLVEGRGVVGGYAAAELLDASCGPADAPVDVVVPGGAYREHPGLVVHRGLLHADEIAVVKEVAVTAPVRTAYDLAREPPLVEAVVAVDALSHRHEFVPQAILDVRSRHLGARGSGQLPEVVRLANPLAESAMDSRTRLIIVLDGLPVPVLQHRVGPYVLDLAYPAIRLAIEYDGEAHPAVIDPSATALHAPQQWRHAHTAGRPLIDPTVTQVLPGQQLRSGQKDHAIFCGTPSGFAACPRAARLLVRVLRRRSSQTANRESSRFTTT